MIAEVVSEAISHAQVDPKDIDNIVVGTFNNGFQKQDFHCLLYTSPSPRDRYGSRMPSSA